MSTWVFLRHGESTANAARVLSGWEDVPLTDKGEREAIHAGLALSAWTFDRVISSDLVRARRTAEIAAERWEQITGLTAPELELEPRLRERNLGEHQGASYQALRDNGVMDTLTSWDGRAAGGESHADLARRGLAALLDHSRDRDPEIVLVVSHGGMIRTLIGLIDGLDRQTLGRQHIKNAAPLARPARHARLQEIVAAL